MTVTDNTDTKVQPQDAPRKQTGQQHGISLYTLLAAVVVLGVLTSVLVTSFSGTHSKGVALYTLIRNIGEAANRFHDDTSCWTYDIAPLYSLDAAQNPSHGYSNTCSRAIPKDRWHGPYIKRMADLTIGDYDGAKIPKFGPNAVIKLIANHRYVDAFHLPEDIAQAAYEACGGEGSMCTHTSTSVGYHYTGDVNR